MSLIVTAWRLVNAAAHAECLISERDGRWQVIVRRGAQILIAERCGTDDAALARANEIWRVLVEQGWTEPRH